MTIPEALKRSVNDWRVLFEVDISQANTQWVNNGAGIWVSDANNLYPWVDSSLLDGFTTQEFGTIASVRVDAIPLINVGSVLGLVAQHGFYYETGTLYIRLEDYSEPSLHDIKIGVLYGFADQDFSPINGAGFYEGRILRTPSVGISRDDLFFGRLVLTVDTIEIVNADGEYDRLAMDEDLYGNEARIWIGQADADYTDYLLLFTGYIDRLSLSEETIRFTIADKRRQLTAPITYSCTNLNGLTAITELIEDAYGIPYNGLFYDTVAWGLATDDAANVTIDMQKPDTVLSVIEDIASSVLGVFIIDADGRFSFKMFDVDATYTKFVPREDILNLHAIEYDPSRVISSVRVGYARDWATSGNQYTYLTDTSREASVFSAYKTYNERTFDTLLITSAAAAIFSTEILDRFDTVRGYQTIDVGMEYYNTQIGDMIVPEVNRPVSTMVGEVKAEVLSRRYDAGRKTVVLGIRHVGNAEALRILEDGQIRITEDDSVRVVESASV